jgi:transposase
VFTREFKIEAVSLVSQQGVSVGEASRRLGIGQNLWRGWRKKLSATGAHAFPSKAQPTALEEENRRLRAENERLRMEREILKKATAFFAKESR